MFQVSDKVTERILENDTDHFIEEENPLAKSIRLDSQKQ